MHIDIAETNQLRRDTVNQYTDLNTIDPLAQKLPTSEYDVVFDAVGGEHTRNSSVESVKPGGVIVHIGLMDNNGSVDMRRLTLQEITLIGCYTYSPLDLQVTMNKLYTGALGELEWIEERPLANGAMAFTDLLKGQCAAPKVVLQVQ